MESMEATITLNGRTFAIIAYKNIWDIPNEQTFWYEVIDESGDVVASSAEHQVFYENEVEALGHGATDAMVVLYSLSKNNV